MATQGPTKHAKADTATLLLVDSIFFALIYMFISAGKAVVAIVFATAAHVPARVSVLSWSSLFVSAALTALIHWVTSNNKDFLYALEATKKRE